MELKKGVTIFLDRDGVINEKAREGDYIKSWSEFRFLPGVKRALRIIKRSGYRIIVVTNQRGISKGLMTIEDLNNIHSMMVSELKKQGTTLDAIYFCPHRGDECNCRKPDIGMFLEAKKDFPDISFEKSYVIGDSLTDLMAGDKVGATNILINTNKGIDMEEVSASVSIYGVAKCLLSATLEYLV